ncbi:MAG: prephenate dehydrogenase [Clostridiales bacterium]|nr:prephenate dehydrogenase [Clostridiales bacterium]
MNIGIIGLGLIGGSMARAIKHNTPHKVYGRDINTSVVLKAKLLDAIDGELTEDNLGDCDLVIVALYPKDTVDFIISHKDKFKEGAIVIDCCGVKASVCKPLFEMVNDCKFTFIGVHPMAGMEFSGFDHSTTAMFENASAIVTPGPDVDIEKVRILKELFDQIGFNHMQVSDYEEHDKVIACTSQLAHIVSSAYVKSPTASMYKGFSAGSFKDMTRVAWLNEKMWTELFFENRENLINEIDGLVDRLIEYSEALKNNDEDKLYNLLSEGRIIKESLS